MKKLSLILSVAAGLSVCALSTQAADADPLRTGIVGLSHGHAGHVFRNLTTEKVEIVGIAESNPVLRQKFAEQFGLPPDLFHSDLHDMLNEAEPEAVAVFTSTLEHLEVVQACAPRGVHVMVEKPLAVNTEHALRMHSLARKHNIHVIINYETTWHPSLEALNEFVFGQNRIGRPRKVVFHHGNDGMIRGRGSDEFIDWLTDPVQNGGGAVTDFGCYGINILTWLLEGEVPISVYAELRQFKPERFPEVDDDALIVLDYEDLQCIIMASWNWAIPRKDAEIYGETGYFIADDKNHYRYRISRRSEEIRKVTGEQTYPVNPPFEYFASLIRGEINPVPYSPGSIENNLIVNRILDAAKKSAETGEKVTYYNE